MNSSAQAVIMDALIFLIVASVVSVTLLNSLAKATIDEDAQQFVERAHRVLLHSTVHWESTGRNQTISEFILLNAQNLDDKQWKMEEEAVKEILDFILLPRFDYCWRIECQNEVHYLGTSDNNVRGDIYASRFMIDEASGVEAVLEAWMRTD